MSDDNSTRQLMSYLKELAKKEHIQTNVVDITPLGLVEMTRKNNGKNIKRINRLMFGEYEYERY